MDKLCWKVLFAVVLPGMVACTSVQTAPSGKVSRADTKVAISAASAAAYQYLQQNAASYYLDNARDQLVVVDEQTDKLHKTHIRFQQVYQTIPVFNGDMIVHLNKDASVYRVTGQIIVVDPVSVLPDITQAEAINGALHLDRFSADGWQVIKTDLYVLRLNKHTHLAYRLELHKGLFREFVFIDAHSGQEVYYTSGMHSGQ